VEIGRRLGVHATPVGVVEYVWAGLGARHCLIGAVQAAGWRYRQEVRSEALWQANTSGDKLPADTAVWLTGR
jgi:hypothetical protein